MEGPEIGPLVFRLSPDALHGVFGEGEGRPGRDFSSRARFSTVAYNVAGERAAAGAAPCVAASPAGGPL